MARRPAVPRENAAARRERALRIAKHLAEAYPDAECALIHRNAWELLIATILSAQCLDATVNRVTPGLFEEFPGAAALAAAPQRRVEKLVRQTGFFRDKARAIRECSHGIVSDFGGEVPREMDALTSLRGVGRKTASVVLGTAFGEPAVFVDTHVRRITRRLGLTRELDPVKIEPDLKRLLPPAEWTMFCHRTIHHGRRTCKARAPQCHVCPIAHLCPRIGVDPASAFEPADGQRIPLSSREVAAKGANTFPGPPAARRRSRTIPRKKTD